AAPALVGPRSAANTETVLASGPSGIFLGYEVDAPAGQANFVASGFNGTGWTSPTVIATQSVHPDLYEDAGGSLRAVWKDTAGLRFRVTLRWKRQRRKGNLFVKVRRTDFYLGAKRLKIDLRAPFLYTYRVLVTQPAGSTITVRARAFIKVKRGKSPKKSLRVKVGVCR